MILPRCVTQAVYILCHLRRQDAASVTAARSIAKAVGVPPEQACKILRSLSQRGLVRSTRGRTGGYALAQPLSEVSMADIFDAVVPPDENRHRRTCAVAPTDACTAQEGLLGFHRRFQVFLENENVSSIINGSCVPSPATEACGVCEAD